MAIVSALNQKGGVGKTSTTYHLAGTLALAGRRVLLVDNDPQSSLTQGFLGPQATRLLEADETIAALYGGLDPFPDRVIRPSGVVGVDLLPGSRHATDANVPRPQTAPEAVQQCLRDFLSEVRERYDLILIDCPPNLHLCSWAALVASDYLIVPLQPEDFGAQGIIDVQDSVARVLAGSNPNLILLGYLITMHNARLSVHKMYEEMLRQMYGADVFATTIPISADFKESLMQRKPIAQFKPRGAAAKTVKALAEEIAQRIAERGPASIQDKEAA